MLSNLIRNAFEHTEEGSIDIACSGARIAIKNPLSGLGGENGQLSAGYGIGMTVIKAISEKLGWTLSASISAGISTAVSSSSSIYSPFGRCQGCGDP